MVPTITSLQSEIKEIKGELEEVIRCVFDLQKFLFFFFADCFYCFMLLIFNGKSSRKSITAKNIKQILVLKGEPNRLRGQNAL